MKSQSIYSHILKDWLWLTFNTEKSVIMYTSGFFAQI